MSKRLTNKLCERLLKTAPSQASNASTWLWGEATIPKSMKKTKVISNRNKEKNC